MAGQHRSVFLALHMPKSSGKKCSVVMVRIMNVCVCSVSVDSIVKCVCYHICIVDISSCLLVKVGWEHLFMGKMASGWRHCWPEKNTGIC